LLLLLLLLMVMVMMRVTSDAASLRHRGHRFRQPHNLVAESNESDHQMPARSQASASAIQYHHDTF
jgi:hypothetical protein